MPPVKFSQRWGDDPFTGLGYTPVPNAIIDYASRIGLDPEECWIIVTILKFKQTADDPYVSQQTLSKIVGKSLSTIQRWLKSIEIKGLMTMHRDRRQGGQFEFLVYDFTPLRAALNKAYQDARNEAAGLQETPAVASGHIAPLADSSPAEEDFIHTSIPPYGKYGCGSESPHVNSAVWSDPSTATRQATRQIVEPYNGTKKNKEENNKNSGLLDELIAIGVNVSVAEYVLTNCDEEVVRLQIAMLPFRSVKEPAAALVASIRENWCEPPAYTKSLDEKRRAEEFELRIKKATAEREAQKQKETEVSSAVENYVSGLTDEEKQELELCATKMFAEQSPKLFASFSRGGEMKSCWQLMNSFRNIIICERLGISRQ